MAILQAVCTSNNQTLATEEGILQSPDGTNEDGSTAYRESPVEAFAVINNADHSIEVAGLAFLATDVTIGDEESPSRVVWYWERNDVPVPEVEGE